MRNILSYQQGTKFTGEEIINWASFQSQNNTSHARQGDYILNHFQLIPEREYLILSSYETFGCGQIRCNPKIIQV